MSRQAEMTGISVSSMVQDKDFLHDTTFVRSNKEEKLQNKVWNILKKDEIQPHTDQAHDLTDQAHDLTDQVHDLTDQDDNIGNRLRTQKQA
ncbi:hypothetical protein COCON_G00224670 [Conger conger]|uniref:Uncharacterized protein n=1 Tax=Conger conger TaxID=82655 RepID=A0A9Q1HLA0_CONCO|nr:hypothetical protein COCON_G00224670 [Conger conger]